MVFRTTQGSEFKGYRLRPEYSQEKQQERIMCKAKDNIISPKAKHSKEHYNTIHGRSYKGHKDVQPSPLDFFPFP